MLIRYLIYGQVKEILQEQRVNKPLIHIFIVCILGTLCFNILNYSVLGAVIIAASFFFIHLIYFNKGFTMVISLFFIIMVFNNFVYYNLKVNGKIFTIEVKDEEKSIGEFQGRKVYLNTGKEKLKQGMTYYVYGSFKGDKNFEKGIIGTVFVEKKDLLKSSVTAKFNSLQKNFYDKLKQEIGEENAALVLSVSLGNTEFLNNLQNKYMTDLGIVHVISVSGFHIALIYSALEKILGFNLSILISLCYVLFTGGKPPTWRAFLMILALKLSKKLWKNYDGISALSMSGIILVFYYPYVIFDIGFQLSYLATLGILLFYKKFKRGLYRLPNKINDGISICIAAQVFTFPVAVLNFSATSLNFLWSNFLLMPIFTIIVVLGNLVFMFSFIPIIYNVLAYFLNLLFIILNGGLYVLNYISLPMVYLRKELVYGYCSILICIYLLINGVKRVKFLPIAIFIGILCSMITVFPKITLVRERWNQCVVLESGIHRLIVTKSDNEFFLNSIKKEFCPTELVILKEKKESYFINGYVVTIEQSNNRLVVKCNGKELSIDEENGNNKNADFYGIIGESKSYKIVKGKLISVK